MKRTLAALLLCGALSASMTGSAMAQSRTVSAAVNGRTITEQAVLDQGVTYVPIRSLLGALGDFTVQWEAETRSAVAAGEGHYIAAPVGEEELYVNGTTLISPDKTRIRNGSTYIPLRLVAEKLGLSVHWDRAKQRAVVSGELPSTYRSEEDLYWLSRIISAESQGEALIGQIAVGNVVLNRVRSEKFADSVKDVVFEVDSGYVQFEPVSNGTIYDEPTYRSMLAAKMALAGCDIVGDSLYFFSPALSSGSWIRANRTYLTTIGCHRFYL